jgi:hypothetical protein
VLKPSEEFDMNKCIARYDSIASYLRQPTFAILYSSRDPFVMGLAEYEPRLVEDALGLKMLCIYCELVFIMSEEWNRLICDIGVLTPSDREAFQAVASEILEVACQQSQSELNGTVEHMRKLRDDLLPLNPG